MDSMFDGGGGAGLSNCAKQNIHTSFEAQVPSVWPYDWSMLDTSSCAPSAPPPSTPPPPPSRPAFTDATLRVAVREWLTDPVAAEATHGHITHWDVSTVKDMAQLFTDHSSLSASFNEPLNWDVSSVTNLRQTFWTARGFNQPLDHWDVTKVTDMYNTFGVLPRSLNPPPRAMAMRAHFSHKRRNHRTPRGQDAREFNQPLGSWNVSRVETLLGLFYAR